MSFSGKKIWVTFLVLLFFIFYFKSNQNHYLIIWTNQNYIGKIKNKKKGKE